MIRTSTCRLPLLTDYDLHCERKPKACRLEDFRSRQAIGNVRVYGHILFTVVEWVWSALADELRKVGELESLERERRRWSGARHSGRRWTQIDDVPRACALKYQTALSATNVVSQDDVSRPFTSQLGTVSDSEWRTLWLEMKSFQWIIDFDFKMLNLLHRLCRCNWCKGLGRLIRQRWRVCLRWCSLERHSHARRSGQFVASSGMERADF